MSRGLGVSLGFRWLCTAAWLTASIACFAGCVDTGQEQAQVSLFAVGVDADGPVAAADDVSVSLDRADLAFGPLYLCAGVSAGDLCETARLEWLGSAVVDLLDPEPVRLAELSGVTGPVRSWMYDLGISSQLSRSDPYVLEAAESLGGTSLVLEGRAEVDGIAIPFEAAIKVQQGEATELGVPVVRKQPAEAFAYDVPRRGAQLTLRFDPADVLRGVNFRAYVRRDPCSDGGEALVCDGTLERTCEGASEVASRDCADQQQICLRDLGCRDRLVVEQDSEAYRGLRNALLGRGRPSFEWGQAL